MTPKQEALFAKATVALDTARRNLDAGDAGASANRAYYATYYAATAALLGTDERPRTHSGTHRQFHRWFVANGRVDPATATALAHGFHVRQRADYEAFAVTDTAAAADLLADAERFVEAVRAVVA